MALDEDGRIPSGPQAAEQMEGQYLACHAMYLCLVPSSCGGERIHQTIVVRAYERWSPRTTTCGPSSKGGAGQADEDEDENEDESATSMR